MLPGIPLSLWWMATSDLYISYIGVPYIFMCTCAYTYHMNFARYGYDPRYLRLDITGQEILAYATLLAVPYSYASIMILLPLFVIVNTTDLRKNAESVLVSHAMTILIVAAHYDIRCVLYWLVCMAIYKLPTRYSSVLWHIGTHITIHKTGTLLLLARTPSSGPGPGPGPGPGSASSSCPCCL